MSSLSYFIMQGGATQTAKGEKKAMVLPSAIILT